MMYTKFRISGVPGDNEGDPLSFRAWESAGPAPSSRRTTAAADEPASKNTDSKGSVPKKTATARPFSTAAASEARIVSENVTSDTDKSARRAAGAVCVTVFFALGLVLLYLSGVPSPDYITDAFLRVCDAVSVQYVRAAKLAQEKLAQDGAQPVLHVFETPESVQTADASDAPEPAESYLAENARRASLSQTAVTAEEASEALPVTAFDFYEPVTPDEPPAGTPLPRDLSRGSDRVYAQNETGLPLDLDALSRAAYPIGAVAAGGGEPVVLILHTHGTEAYADDGGRSDDTARNVVSAGAELAAILEDYGIPTLHSTTMHDALSYIASYKSARNEIAAVLKAHPSIRYVVDLHRDALPPENGAPVKPVVSLFGEDCAQMMFVAGTSAGGGAHPDYLQNLTVTAHLQKRLIDLYPALMRPVNVRPAVFNQDLCPGAILLEVGSDANTRAEALAAVRLFARGFAECIIKGE